MNLKFLAKFGYYLMGTVVLLMVVADPILYFQVLSMSGVHSWGEFVLFLKNVEYAAVSFLFLLMWVLCLDLARRFIKSLKKLN